MYFPVHEALTQMPLVYNQTNNRHELANTRMEAKTYKYYASKPAKAENKLELDTKTRKCYAVGEFNIFSDGCANDDACCSENQCNI